MTSIHQFKVAGIDGERIDFARFEGKKIMVVNVASACGYTSQYQQLQELYEAFQHKLIIVGFPSNDFGGQEPGDEHEIQAFCTTTFGVKFPLAAKVNIKGDTVHPIYQWLTREALNGRLDSTVEWNFQKYLLNEQGHIVATLAPSIEPLNEQIIDWLEEKAPAI